MMCFLSLGNERAHVAKVMARQRSSKKTGRPHLVNTQMRVKPVTPLVLNGELLTRKNKKSSYFLIRFTLCLSKLIPESLCIFTLNYCLTMCLFVCFLFYKQNVTKVVETIVCLSQG